MQGGRYRIILCLPPVVSYCIDKNKKNTYTHRSITLCSMREARGGIMRPHPQKHSRKKMNVKKLQNSTEIIRRCIYKKLLLAWQNTASYTMKCYFLHCKKLRMANKGKRG